MRYLLREGLTVSSAACQRKAENVFEEIFELIGIILLGATLQGLVFCSASVACNKWRTHRRASSKAATERKITLDKRAPSQKIPAGRDIVCSLLHSGIVRPVQQGDSSVVACHLSIHVLFPGAIEPEVYGQQTPRGVRGSKVEAFLFCEICGWWIGGVPYVADLSQTEKTILEKTGEI